MVGILGVNAWTRVRQSSSLAQLSRISESLMKGAQQPYWQYLNTKGDSNAYRVYQDDIQTIMQGAGYGAFTGFLVNQLWVSTASSSLMPASFLLITTVAIGALTAYVVAQVAQHLAKQRGGSEGPSLSRNHVIKALVTTTLMVGAIALVGGLSLEVLRTLGNVQGRLIYPLITAGMTAVGMFIGGSLMIKQGQYLPRVTLSSRSYLS